MASLPAKIKSSDGIRFASIGPITSSTLRELGLPVDIEAKEYTIPGLIKAILDAGVDVGTLTTVDVVHHPINQATPSASNYNPPEARALSENPDTR